MRSNKVMKPEIIMPNKQLFTESSNSALSKTLSKTGEISAANLSLKLEEIIQQYMIAHSSKNNNEFEKTTNNFKVTSAVPDMSDRLPPQYIHQTIETSGDET